MKTDARRLALIVTTLIAVFILAACNPSSAGAPSGTKTSATATPVILAASTMSGPEASATSLAGPTLTTSTSGSGGCANAYFPVSSGATWSYASAGSVAGDYSYNRSLAGISDTGFIASDEFNSGVTRTTKWGCKDGNLTMLETGSAGGVASSTGMKVTIDSVTSNGYVIPATFAAGQTWSETLELNTTNEAKGKKTGTAQSVSQTNCTAGEPESVKVPAGTFDAVKITCHSNQVATVTLTVGGTTGPITTIQDSTQWYAQGVGMVQTMNSGDAGNETIQLTSYSIP